MCVLKVTLKSTCLVSPLGGFEDCKYQIQQAVVLLIKIAYVLLTWLVSRLIYRTARASQRARGLFTKARTWSEERGVFRNRAYLKESKTY